MTVHKAFDLNIEPLGIDSYLITSNQSEHAAIVSKVEANILQELGSFTSITQQVNATIDRLGLDGKLTTSLVTSIKNLADKQLIWSKDELTEAILARSTKSTHDQAKITSLNIPTCNRPVYLKRALESYVSNARTFNRNLTFTVSDDSTVPATAQLNLESLRQVSNSFQTPIHYLNRAHRMQYAHQLATQANIPLAILEFALLGHPQCTAWYGANRNSLLLNTVGELTLQVDDDTICKISESEGNQDKISLDSNYNTNDFIFFGDKATAKKTERIRSLDFAGLHEQVLGKHPGQCILGRQNPETLDFKAMSPELFNLLNQPNTKILTSYIGSLGDSGMENTSFITSLTGKSFRQLTANQESYHLFLKSRQMLRTTRDIVLGEHQGLMTMNVGLDNRGMLPPFMPVQRSEDSIFQVLLSTAFNNSLAGSLPYFLLHDPPENRSSSTRLVFRTNDLLKQLLFAFKNWPQPDDSTLGLISIGNHLTYLASLNPISFTHYVHDCCQQALANLIQTAEHRIVEQRDAPNYWLEDIQAYLSDVQAFFTQKKVIVPDDLPGSNEEKWSLFQELVYQYGTLLVHWPAIIDAAKTLKQQEYKPGNLIQASK